MMLYKFWCDSYFLFTTDFMKLIHKQKVSQSSSNTACKAQMQTIKRFIGQVFKLVPCVTHVLVSTKRNGFH